MSLRDQIAEALEPLCAPEKHRRHVAKWVAGDVMKVVAPEIEGRDARVRELEEENQRMRAKLSAIDLVQTWTNEDGKSFIFTDDLLIATGDITPDALSRAREIADTKEEA